MLDCKPLGSNCEMPLDSSADHSDVVLAVGAEHETHINIKDFPSVRSKFSPM